MARVDPGSEDAVVTGGGWSPRPPVPLHSGRGKIEKCYGTQTDVLREWHALGGKPEGHGVAKGLGHGGGPSAEGTSEKTSAPPASEEHSGPRLM